MVGIDKGSRINEVEFIWPVYKLSYGVRHHKEAEQNSVDSLWIDMSEMESAIDQQSALCSQFLEFHPSEGMLSIFLWQVVPIRFKRNQQTISPCVGTSTQVQHNVQSFTTLEFELSKIFISKALAFQQGVLR